MSDEEEVVSEEEMSEEEEESAPSSPTRKSAPVEDSGPSEAELAMQRRRQQWRSEFEGQGLDEFTREVLEQSRLEREKEEEEIEILRRRREQRKKEREEEERRMAERRAEEEARRKAEEEERRRQKDSLEAERREAREKKMAEMQKWKNPPKPNFVITKKAGEGGGSSETDGAITGQKTKEQIENEKRNTLAQRIQKLEISGFDSSKLSEKAKELHNLIYRLESEKYDLEVRFKRQQYDMMELAEKARQMTKGGKGKKVQVSDEADKMQELFAGCPAKIEMYSKYERQKDKRNYVSRKVVFAGPVYGYPAPRINPKRAVVWDDAGLPQYVEKEGEEENHAEPQAEEAAE
ncbi:DgyrCDS7028 [Dimorphilus gyrociliatus]|uniref:DgyrCDS7028 n=1 Tax=Dimorphilus gyrociliatus TaxID=2664684 RepID=A0A7I8VQ07_9ANNE|nr:DgyrCDS7028 [Dimorphilus gyrociliatus]